MTSTETQTISRVQPQRPDTAIQLAEKLTQMFIEDGYLPNTRIPAERELSKRYGATRHAIRRALQLLEQQGVVYRMAGTGVFVQGFRKPGEWSDSSSHLRYVNILVHHVPTPQLAFTQTESLAAYTETLDAHDAKMRFVMCPGKKVDYHALFSDKCSFREQGCVLKNFIHPALMAWLTEREIPFVVQYYYRYPREGLCNHYRVYVNREGAAYKGTKYLFELGHERIGFLGALPGGSANVTAYYKGYTAAFMLAGLHVNPDLMVYAYTDDPKAAVLPATKLLQRKDRPTAIIAQTDGIAIGVLEAAHSLGIRVPEELSVIGYNDQPGAATTDPPLTTFNGCHRLVAQTAVQMLIDIAEKKYDSPQTTVLNCPLIVRKSAGPAP